MDWLSRCIAKETKKKYGGVRSNLHFLWTLQARFRFPISSPCSHTYACKEMRNLGKRTPKPRQPACIVFPFEITFFGLITHAQLVIDWCTNSNKLYSPMFQVCKVFKPMPITNAWEVIHGSLIFSRFANANKEWENKCYNIML